MAYTVMLWIYSGHAEGIKIWKKETNSGNERPANDISVKIQVTI